jgi:hypothetical protein
MSTGQNLDVARPEHVAKFYLTSRIKIGERPCALARGPRCGTGKCAAAVQGVLLRPRAGPVFPLPRRSPLLHMRRYACPPGVSLGRVRGGRARRLHPLGLDRVINLEGARIGSREELGLYRYAPIRRAYGAAMGDREVERHGLLVVGGGRPWTAAAHFPVPQRCPRAKAHGRSLSLHRRMYALLTGAFLVKSQLHPAMEAARAAASDSTE